jgi:hypothetical protein
LGALPGACEEVGFKATAKQELYQWTENGPDGRFAHSASAAKSGWSSRRPKPTPVSIGERRRPDPNGHPGYLRVDTVHQGGRDGAKDVYHINAVDEVTQRQIVGAAPHISEAWLMPRLEAMPAQFPFHIQTACRAPGCQAGRDGRRAYHAHHRQIQRYFVKRLQRLGLNVTVEPVPEAA